MLTVEYCKEGLAVSDFDAVQFVREMFQEQDGPTEFQVSTSAVIQQIRLEVARKDIAPEVIQFKYNGQILTINEFGYVMPSYPDGFADADMRISEDIMRVNHERHVREEKQIQLELQFLSLECVDDISLQFSGDSLAIRRIKAIRQLVPGCGLKHTKEWLDDNRLI